VCVKLLRMPYVHVYVVHCITFTFVAGFLFFFFCFYIDQFENVVSMTRMMQRNAESDRGLRTSGISSAIRTRNIQPGREPIEQRQLVFGRQRGETKPSTSAMPRGLG
jgi:hypothetical protein